ncbi:short chain dehydrogenase [Streptomyces hoynatensis]|uniref:Short chain dehydrogenase n=1 Tax=Streptomyces hoynatensis TaxID=1141874 RepID=A0A3A9Z5A6_9ACTN|nr:short chain dehydrogenase [Streptomyces hoynatensis]RKN43199.1 short chain dehydrogenase [Streptomyces hoynatensis]
MKTLVIGATGVIGRAVSAALEEAGHEVVRASRRGGVRVDIADPDSVAALLASLPGLGAVVCCAASGNLTRLTEGTDAEYLTGLEGKLLGQVRLVRQAIGHLGTGGSITLTGGVFEEPTPGGSFGALVNAGLEAFAAAAAVDLPDGPRVNVVSPGWVSETLEAMGRDGAAGTPARDVARAYLAAVTGTYTGRVLRPTRA